MRGSNQERKGKREEREKFGNKCGEQSLSDTLDLARMNWPNMQCDWIGSLPEDMAS